MRPPDRNGRFAQAPANLAGEPFPSKGSDLLNIADAITRHARTRRQHPAIEDGERIVTYGELDALVDHAAGNLQADGIAPGDTVVLIAADSSDQLIVIGALARIGAIAFAINPWLPDAEIAQRLDGLDPAAAIVDGSRRNLGKLRRLALGDICKPASKPGARFEAAADHPLTLSQSSGSTGRPKSFLRSHGQMQERFQRYIPNLGWAPEDRYLALMSMSFDLGRTLCLGMLHVGGTVILDHTRSPDELAATIRDKAITFLHVTPMHVGALLGLPENPARMFPHLRAIFVGTAAITHAQLVQARQRITANVVETYGTNEIGLVSTLTPAEQDQYPGALGRVIDGVEAEIVNERDEPQPPNALGPVRYRIALPPTGYLNNPQANSSAFRDGWFYPGDVATLNEAGILVYKGRADDVINNAGAKFYPIEVENTLLEHPEVSEAAVFGWPHPPIGEVAVAAIVARAPVDNKTLVRFCRRRIAAAKVPRFFLFLPELPKGAQNKVRKDELKQLIGQEIAKARARHRS